MMRWLAFWLVLGQMAQAAGDEAGFLTELRKSHAREHAAQLAEAEKPLLLLKEKYKAALQQYRDEAQAAGRLKSVVAADKALAALAADAPVGASEDPEVAKLEKIFETNRKAGETQSRQATLRVDQAYFATLTNLVPRLTKAGQIDAAVEVQAEADALAASINQRTAREAEAALGSEVVVATSFIPHDPKVRAQKNPDVPPPAVDDAAAKATFKVLGAERHKLSGELAVLGDGKPASNENSPPENFFFDPAAKGGKILIDLGSVIPVEAVATYSWHLSIRGPQVFVLYAADGSDPNFSPDPPRGKNPRSAGWQQIASVDTRPRQGDGGGKHSVLIATRNRKPLGQFRYLLIDASPTSDLPEANTFFSEIDVISPATRPR